MVAESGAEDSEGADAREDWPKKQKPRGVAPGLL
jgi:hypothetical protein